MNLFLVFFVDQNCELSCFSLLFLVIKGIGVMGWL